MKRAATLTAVALFLLAPLPSIRAAEPLPDYPVELPGIEAVQRAIDGAAEVRAAQASRRVELATRRQLVAGPQEWSARVDNLQRRAAIGSSTERWTDWELAIERPLRSSTKAELDRRLGDRRVAEAEVALADARHETARQLLELWYRGLRERASEALLREQAGAAVREAAIVTRRRQLGDASQLDEIQAQAAAAQAEAAARLATERAMRAATVLGQRFPGLALPEAVPLPDPAPPAPELARLGEVAVQEDHGLLLARAAAARGRVEGERALAQRRPDPTVGVRMASERSGEDSMVGLYLSIPIGGEARRAQAEASIAAADALEYRRDALEARLRADVGSLVVAVKSSYTRWRASEDAAALQARVVERTSQAHGLGEAGLAVVLLARRQASDAALVSAAARIDALESRARLLLDAHRLWDFDEPPAAD